MATNARQDEEAHQRGRGPRPGEPRRPRRRAPRSRQDRRRQQRRPARRRPGKGKVGAGLGRRLRPRAAPRRLRRPGHARRGRAPATSSPRPVPDQMEAATRAVDGGAGVLHIVKNYTGDVLNFQLAAELVAGEVEVAIGRDQRRRRGPGLALHRRPARRRRAPSSSRRSPARRPRPARRSPTSRRPPSRSTPRAGRWASP